MKIVHCYANGCFDSLISLQQIVNLLREAISILSGKYKRFTFLDPVAQPGNQLKSSFHDFNCLQHPRADVTRPGNYLDDQVHNHPEPVFFRI